VEGLEEVTRSPGYSTAVGLLLFAKQQRPLGGRSQGASVGQLIGKIPGWLKGHF
jgi:cell division protein FtsA